MHWIQFNQDMVQRRAVVNMAMAFILHIVRGISWPVSDYQLLKKDFARLWDEREMCEWELSTTYLSVNMKRRKYTRYRAVDSGWHYRKFWKKAETPSFLILGWWYTFPTASEDDNKMMITMNRKSVISIASNKKCYQWDLVIEVEHRRDRQERRIVY